jgi:hypothetical protein
MPARRLTTTLMAFTLAQGIETTCIYSVAGRTVFVTTYPFIPPSHHLQCGSNVRGGVMGRPSTIMPS